jgi:8-oxo-dGTP diphosphatase
MNQFTVEQRFHHKLRVRACGVLRRGDRLLCIQLFSPVTQQPVWTFPGGGVEVGESLQEAVKREFEEETGIEVHVQSLLYVNELIQSPFHAIEFYFEVVSQSTNSANPPPEPKLGQDPENDSAYLLDLKFLSKEELSNVECSPAFFVKDYWQAASHPNFSFHRQN